MDRLDREGSLSGPLSERQSTGAPFAISILRAFVWPLRAAAIKGDKPDAEWRDRSALASIRTSRDSQQPFAAAINKGMVASKWQAWTFALFLMSNFVILTLLVATATINGV